MLTSLRVRNLALVEDVQMELRPGLNMVTGETGAGKSILIGALGLALGGRADRSLIRAGESSCVVEAVFELGEAGPIKALLEESGLDASADGGLVVRRVVRQSGASQHFLNDQNVTQQLLRRVGDLLVDLHGPHDHQSLLDHNAQRELLDAFGHTAPARAAWETVYREQQALLARREALTESSADPGEEADLLAFRVKEIEEAALEEGEEERLQEEHALLGNAHHILELASEAVQALTEGEPSALDGLAAAQRTFEALERLWPEAAQWHAEIRQAAVQVREVSTTVSEAAEALQADPERLGWLDERLALYDKLKRKFGGSVPEILAKLERYRERLHDLQTRDEQLARLDQQLRALDGALKQAGSTLTQQRCDAAGRLAEAVTNELRALGFPHGAFTIEIQAVPPALSGVDAVEFGFAPNAGEPARPLRTIASSGEISRVMLACKAVLADHDRIPTLIFDEIDANVGGEMGSAIGRKLAQIANTRQVICITHLPQVAIFGPAHFAVRKEVRGGRTYTRVESIEAEDRVEELARMLGGRDLTRVTLDHAREMLEKAGAAR